jgi:hypothetical protein
VFIRIAEPSDSLAGELLALLPDLCVIADENPRVTVCFDLGGWSPVLFADILGAGFDLLTYRKGPAPDVPVATFTTVACADDRGRHDYDLATRTVTLDITARPRNGQGVSLRQVTPRVPGPRGLSRQIHSLISRTDLSAAEVCWRMSSRWREENYFRCARARFALDSYPQIPDDQKRMVPSSAKKTAATGVRAAAQADRDAALLRFAQPRPRALRDPHQPGPQRPVEAAWRELAKADAAAVATPGPRPARRSGPGYGPAGRRDQADHARHPDGRLQRPDHPCPRPPKPLRARLRRAGRAHPRIPHHLGIWGDIQPPRPASC